MTRSVFVSFCWLDLFTHSEGLAGVLLGFGSLAWSRSTRMVLRPKAALTSEARKVERWWLSSQRRRAIYQSKDWMDS
jgi:hypothetical protein